MKSPTYSELFDRNRGVFTADQQQRVRHLKIAIAGCGGVGGVCAYLLARLGVCEFHLADPEAFEPSNVNRQFGAYVDTIGMNKAGVVARELSRINPFARLRVHDGELSVRNMADFVHGASCVVDGIDFAFPDISLELHDAARRRGVWAFVAQGAGTLHTQFALDPSGARLRERVIQRDGSPDLLALVSAHFPVSPRELTDSMMLDLERGALPHIPSSGITLSLGISCLAQDIVRVLVLGLPPVAVFPDVWTLDTLMLESRLFRRSGIPSPPPSRTP